MSLVSMIGPRPNLLGRQAGTHKRLEVVPAGPDQRRPGEDPRRSTSCWTAPSAPPPSTPPGRPSEGADGLERALERLCREATDAVLADNNILILSDRATSAGPHRRSRRRWPPRPCIIT